MSPKKFADAGAPGDGNYQCFFLRSHLHARAHRLGHRPIRNLASLRVSGDSRSRSFHSLFRIHSVWCTSISLPAGSLFSWVSRLCAVGWVSSCWANYLKATHVCAVVGVCSGVLVWYNYLNASPDCRAQCFSMIIRSFCVCRGWAWVSSYLVC